ncbi:exonuclease SbcD [Lachnospiraceae bacterium PF1-22]|uniref:exonuclease SbcCD subunit D n=1 Tax=Ohessyouella blattaphilus TaxID=2949333 RepID=UPI003E2146B3
MIFFHLADLHIGKSLHHYNLLEDQRYVLAQVVREIRRVRPAALLLAGDIYDKSVPSAEAVRVFSEFLDDCLEAYSELKILVISGNHDSGDRLDFAAEILARQHLYIAGNTLKKVVIVDEYGPVNFYLSPFFKPAYLRKQMGKPELSSYNEAMKLLLEQVAINDQERNVLLAHQFFVNGKHLPEMSDSEIITVGGLDQIDIVPLRRFAYVALGHLHKPQRVGEEYIRYSGSPLKYSVSEADHQKSLSVISLAEPGEKAQIEEVALSAWREVMKKRGTLAELLTTATPSERQAYISLTMTDEKEMINPKGQLESVYERILELRLDNTNVRARIKELDEATTVATPLEVFGEFYQEMSGRELSLEEEQIMTDIINQAGEEDVCDH